MKIDSIADLEKFIRLCRKHGITDVKVDNLEFHLGSKPTKPRRVTRSADPLSEAEIAIPKFGGIPDQSPEEAREAYNRSRPQKDVSDEIDTPDALTDEELLFYSVKTDETAIPNGDIQ